MKYTKDEVIQYAQEEDVKFIRITFSDVFGAQKNISIMPGELKRAFEQGIAFDASAVKGFGNEAHSDLLLFPDPDTLSVLPWRPDHGRVIRLLSTIKQPNGEIFECAQLGNAAWGASFPSERALPAGGFGSVHTPSP